MTKFFATCPKGLEYLLKDELIAIGASDVRRITRAVLPRRTVRQLVVAHAEADRGDDSRCVSLDPSMEFLAAVSAFAIVTWNSGPRGSREENAL